MDAQVLLIIGVVVVVAGLMVVWQQRQGVVKRPSASNEFNEGEGWLNALAEGEKGASAAKEQLPDWLRSKEDVGAKRPLAGDEQEMVERLHKNLQAHAPHLNLAQTEQILAEIKNGRKINAIKLYREITNSGLKEAKDAIDAIEQGNIRISPVVSSVDVEQRIQQELKAGRKINAVKLYRETYKVGLKEAKDAVDAMERQLGL